MSGDAVVCVVLEEYLREIQARFCPYIAPSHSRGLLHFEHHHIDADDVGSAITICLQITNARVAEFRSARFQLSIPDQKLLCYNLTFEFTESSVAKQSETVLAWVHWLLKLVYCSVNVMFGKFWLSQKFIAHNGQLIPPPPMDFLSIRSGIKAIDPHKFFTFNPELKSLALLGTDDQSDPLATILGEGALEPTNAEQMFRDLQKWALTTHSSKLPERLQNKCAE